MSFDMAKGWVEVRNIKTDTPSADWVFYCGRDRSRCKPGMIFADLGNPYVVNEHQTREEAIARFKAEMDARESPRSLIWQDAAEWMFRAVRDGQTVELFCHCDPLPCHCQVIQHEAILKAIFPETPETSFSWQR